MTDSEAEAQKLRDLRAKIEDLMREADVCGHVVLAGKAGRFEGFSNFAASWSNLVMEHRPKGEYLRLRSKRADYADAETQKLHQEWSVGVVSGLGLMLGQTAMAYITAADQFDKATGAEHTPLTRDDPRDDPE